MPISEYLRTSYHPDREYVDGEVRERNLGETDHSYLQGFLTSFFFVRRAQWGISVFPEQRVQVKATRFRVPDLSIVLGPRPATPILHAPPFLCIEILSCDDRMVDVQEEIHDYLSFGVQSVWVINPQTLQASMYTPDGVKETRGGVLRTQNPEFAVPLSELD